MSLVWDKREEMYFFLILDLHQNEFYGTLIRACAIINAHYFNKGKWAGLTWAALLDCFMTGVQLPLRPDEGDTSKSKKKNKTCSRGKQQQQWLWETKTIAHVNPLKDILGRFMLIPEMGLEHSGVRASLVFGHRKQRFGPHGQTTNRQLRRKQGVCQLSGSFSSRPASLRPLTASVGTCPTLSNISTLIHTE